ncbi:TIGR04222 domain-containing membrane protein [Streptosporangium sp. DT93]|uniref:TIGR04222 domain-containing membrane protein n=1 Tax=Streptosporangium sp. DT93 TaxID=3393428 RepID=UPI003CEBC774
MWSLLFVVAVAIALVVILTASALRREQRRVRSVMAGNGAGPPTPYELAYLSGGPRRVVNTALGLLAKAGPIRVSRGGLVSLVAGAPPSPDPIEHAVMEALHLRGGTAPLGDLRRAVSEGKGMESLRYRLLGLGLLVPDSALDHARILLKRLLIASVAAAVFTVGCLVAGPGQSIPAVLIGLLATIGGLSSHARQKRALRDTLSRSGRDVLTTAYRTHVRGTRPVTGDLAFAIGVPVALYGLGELNEPGLQEELQRPDPGGATSGCATGACGGGSGSGDGSFGGGGDFGSGGWGDSGGSSGDSGGSSGGSSCGGGGGCGGGGCGGG